ncbi:hypothetical protein [Tardiphaga sp. vice304]|uniref:hypothetical protein n=1 Tax=Tardiphaga sp. vice304 TaxID=2592817 RepID=UPI00143D5F0E|nr:hypothetical protein [Tardiphaga sp. vice304]
MLVRNIFWLQELVVYLDYDQPDRAPAEGEEHLADQFVFVRFCYRVSLAAICIHN